MTRNQRIRSGVVLTALVIITGASCRPLSNANGTAAIRTREDAAGDRAGSPTAATAEWVFLARNEAIYLRWSAPNGAVAGVIQTARRGADRASVKVTSGILAGAANGRHVVLRAGQQTWSGTVDGDALVLAMTRSDGARDELRFLRGSVGDFDAAVAALRPVPTTTTVRRPPKATSTTTATVTTVERPPAGPDPRALLADLEAATSRLRALRSTNAAVGRTEGALDTMYQAADAVYVTLGRPRCTAARGALARLGSASAQVEQEVGTIEQEAAEIEEQRAAVMDVGMRVVALDDPAMNPVITGTNDELSSADTAISELRRYAGEVRTAVATTTTEAEQSVGSRC